jgi:hypothetical protein
MKSGVALDISDAEQSRVKALHPEDWFLGPLSYIKYIDH